MAGAALIEIENLSVGFTGRSGATLPVLRNVSLRARQGETIGLVCESGSGKSTLALAAMGYLKRGLRVIGGTARFQGQDLFALDRPTLEKVRGGRLALIPQNSGQSLTPTIRIGRQIAEALSLHSALPASEHPRRVVDLLTMVRLPDPAEIAGRYPHELSGGQQQRAAIAMALAGEPEALLLDEPTTGLDVTTQAHILELLREVTAETGVAMIYVSHDLGAIARVCDRVAVMYAGEIVLEGTARQVLRRPSHPYARGLLASIPRLREARPPVALEGRPPAPGEAGRGCGFVNRCALAQDLCRRQRPDLAGIDTGELTRCHFPDRAATLVLEGSGAARLNAAQTAGGPALTLTDLSIRYDRPSLLDEILRRPPSRPATVQGLSLLVRKGETIGLVGESGSGKSTILKAIAGLLGLAAGRVDLGDGEVLSRDVDLRTPDQRRRVQLIFQNPDESLNPRQTVAEILAQPLTLYFGLVDDALRARSVALLAQVRLGPHYLDRLPTQLSGGEKQRVAIARAFAAEPEILLCDEVTSALDVSVQAAVLELLNQLKRDQGTTYLFVSHDLAVVRALSDRVAVLYQGRLCEIGSAADVYDAPFHPYSEALIGAVLEPDPDHRPQLIADDVVESSPPPKGCAFQRRCARRIGAICDQEEPPWREGDGGHAIRCHIPRETLMTLQSGGAPPLGETP